LRIYNRYIFLLVVAFSSIDISLAFLGQNDLVNYFVINIIAYLVITLLFVYLNPKARMALNTISVVLFAGFIVIVALKVTEILSGR
jgi:hypothetical protein